MTTGDVSLGRETPSRPATSRAIKRERLRAQVEHVALDLFRAHGFDEVSVERIASEAGVGPATFYRYFGTKDGVLFAYQTRWLQTVRDAALALDVDQPRPQQLHDLVVTVVDSFNAELDTMELRDAIVLANPTLLPRTLAVQRAWEQELARSLAERRRCPVGDPTVQLDAALVLLVMRMAFRQWRAGAATSLTEAVSAVLDAARDGLIGSASPADRVPGV